MAFQGRQIVSIGRERAEGLIGGLGLFGMLLNQIDRYIDSLTHESDPQTDLVLHGCVYLS